MHFPPFSSFLRRLSLLLGTGRVIRRKKISLEDWSLSQKYFYYTYIYIYSKILSREETSYIALVVSLLDFESVEWLLTFIKYPPRWIADRSSLRYVQLSSSSSRSRIIGDKARKRQIYTDIYARSRIYVIVARRRRSIQSYCTNRKCTESLNIGKYVWSLFRPLISLSL